jgi:hypothetical protein
MPRDVLRGPDLAAGVLAVAVLPNVVDGQRSGAFAGFDFGPEEAPDDVVVDGQAILREYRVAELLEFFQDLVIDTGIVVIRRAVRCRRGSRAPVIENREPTRWITLSNMSSRGSPLSIARGSQG